MEKNIEDGVVKD